MSKTKKIPLMGPIRVNLEAFGVAILAAVLLKWFCIEAYQIPTSSMQPTLMGDDSSQVFDRILVDKLLQTFREPQRWDITVFRYPLQKNQNYVKRIVGMPNDRLHIAGGNVYQVSDADGRRSYGILRKPADLQEELWKEIYPARRLVRNESKAINTTWSSSPSSAGAENDTGFTLELSSGTRKLYFRDADGNGVGNFVWDGYPTAVAAAMQERFGSHASEIVPDVRLAATIVPDASLEELALEVAVLRTGLDKLTFGLVVKDGKGRLTVTRNDSEVAGASPEFPVALAAGRPTRLRFAHVDDELIAWVDGAETQRFDCAEWDCRAGCVGEGSNGTLAATQRVTPQFTCKGTGKGSVRIDDVVLERDLHYTRFGSPEVIEVPEGHYYMMGDNTLQSIDSRGWTAITVGVTPDGRIVPPDTEGARNVRGNKRAMPLSRAPDRDETPIPIPSEHAIVMIDEYGEILRLQGDAAGNWAGDSGNVTFRAADGTEWQARDTTNTKGVSFVPRSDIQGRALMVFYPLPPISWLTGNNWPSRFGFVR